MNKQEFLAELRNGLSGLPEDEIEERLTFYSEMIDDRMEEGLSENDALCEIGSIDEIISQTIRDTTDVKHAKERHEHKRKFKVWELVLLVLGSPIWGSLLIAAFAVVISVFIILWSVIISTWAVFLSLATCFLGGIICGVTAIAFLGSLSGVALIGAGIACAGLSIFAFHGCKISTKGIFLLTKNSLTRMKKSFTKKEAA